jgi:hypothetical protein
MSYDGWKAIKVEYKQASEGKIRGSFVAARQNLRTTA